MRKKVLIIGAICAAFLSACGEADRRSNVDSLHLPYKMNAFSDGSAAKKTEFRCPSTPGEPPKELEFKSFYKKSDPQRAQINKKARKKYEKQTADLRKFENDLAMMANSYLKSGRNNQAVAHCTVDWLYEWASGDAYLGEANTQGEFIRQWGLAVVASAYAQVKSVPDIDPAKDKVIKTWLLNVAQNVMQDYSGSSTSSVKMQNNHLYWAAWAVTMTAASLDRHDLYKWGVNKAKYAILAQMRDDGTLPLEMNRGKKALHYHIFAMTPLLLIAETATRNGENLYELKNGILHVAAKRLFAGIKDPATFSEQAGAEQESVSKISNEHFAWLELYNSRFPDPEMEAWLDSHRPVFSRRAGGDVRFLFRTPNNS